MVRFKNGAAAAGCRLGKFPSSLAAKKVSAKELENFTRLLSSLLAAGVPLSRALVILQKEASSPAAKAQVEGNSRSRRGRHVAGGRDGEIAGNFSARLCRDGRGGRGRRISRRGAGADRGISIARKGTEIEGDDRDAVSVHFAGARAGRADGAAGVFHSEISERVCQHPRFAAADHATHHWREPCGALLRIVRRGGAGRIVFSGAHLVRLRKRQAHVGGNRF